MLGTYWTKEQINEFCSTSVSTLDSFVLPLAYLIQPKLKEMLSPKTTSDYPEAENLADLPKEEFLNKMRTNAW